MTDCLREPPEEPPPSRRRIALAAVLTSLFCTGFWLLGSTVVFPLLGDDRPALADALAWSLFYGFPVGVGLAVGPHAVRRVRGGSARRDESGFRQRRLIAILTKASRDSAAGRATQDAA